MMSPKILYVLAIVRIYEHLIQHCSHKRLMYSGHGEILILCYPFHSHVYCTSRSRFASNDNVAVLVWSLASPNIYAMSSRTK